jgi:hypothetical protein
VLTTTIDGLWVLQAVTGVEQLCPELGLRPLLPRLETAEYALRHPVVPELVACGALDEAGNPDRMIREWMTVLLRRDLGLLLHISVPGREPTRAAICRFASWWVVLERHGDLVRLYPVGTASNEAAAAELVVGQVERLCGVAEAAPLRPVTVRTEELLESVHDAVSLRSFLLGQRLDVDQLHIITMAADPARSAYAAIVALQAGVGPDKTARLAIGESSVAIVDTSAGRLCVEGVTSGGRRYQVLSPGSRSDIGVAVRRLIQNLPAGEE